VGYPNATESMADGFGGTLAAPIWHDFMSAASDGYCGDFPVPAVLWHGTQFVGSFSASRAPIPTTGSGTSATGQTAPGSGGTGISPSGNNPTLFAQPPQPGGGNGGGNGNGGGGGHGHGGGPKTGGAGPGTH
jgi:hypothetical protein